MLRIAVPLAGRSVFYDESDNQFPKIFQEINRKPMIQVVIENLMSIERKKRFLFVVNDYDIERFRLDEVLRNLTDNQCDIVVQRAATHGAVCSLLLGVDYLDNDDPLLISNADQLLDHDLNNIVGFFLDKDLDGGVVCFDSVHPHWSYARLNDDDQLTEVAEKKPISRNAIAGLYYFARGRDFVTSTKQAILKDRHHEGRFYTSLVFNELILGNRNLQAYRIQSDEYHNFYSPEKIEEYTSRTSFNG